MKRQFEFGILNIPNPAYTNAAHKNGVMSIACIYFDQAFREGQTVDELLIQDEDGRFIIADKLIEMAEYFGYDGYFFNCEEAPYSYDVLKQWLYSSNQQAFTRSITIRIPPLMPARRSGSTPMLTATA